MRFEWAEHFTKDIERMDATHREFVQLVDRLLSADDEALVAGLDELLQHSREHFEQEQRWMLASGFPPTAIHQSEHQRVLGILEQTLKLARSGDLGVARGVVQSLPQWFEQHAASMDNALALHMKHVGLDGNG